MMATGTRTGTTLRRRWSSSPSSSARWVSLIMGISVSGLSSSPLLLVLVLVLVLLLNHHHHHHHHHHHGMDNDEDLAVMT